MASDLHEWIPLKRGDSIPENAVYSGQTGADGKVYIAKIDNSPGKVNLENGKIHNFWSQKYSSRTQGEVLISYGINSWKELKYGNTIPDGAILGGRDYRSDKVWVGKDITTDEPGKITCINSKDSILSMCRLWCHSYWSTADVQIANILIIESEPEPEPEPVPAPVPAHAHAPAPAPEPIKRIEPQKLNENCEWGETIQYSNYEEHIKTVSIDISIDNIVSGIIETIAIASGELTHLTSLLKNDVKARLRHSSRDSSALSESVVSASDEKYYIIMKYHKKNSENTGIMGGVFNWNSSDYILEIEYAILEPINELAREKCRAYKRRCADRIIERLDN